MPRLLHLLFLLAGGLSTLAQTPPVNAEAHIRAILAQQSDAWNRGDIEAYMQSGYWKSDSLLFMGKTGPAWGYDSTLARYRRGYANAEKMGQLTFTIYKVEIMSSGSSAWVAGGWQIKRAAGNLGGAFLLVWKRFPEGWRIVADHSS